MAREDVGGLPVIKIEVIMEAEPALPSIVDVGMGARIGSAVGGGTTTCTVSLPPFPPRTMAATRIIAAVTTAPKPPNSNQTGIPPMPTPGPGTHRRLSWWYGRRSRGSRGWSPAQGTFQGIRHVVRRPEPGFSGLRSRPPYDPLYSSRHSDSTR